MFPRKVICDWACENRAYLHKLHMFIKWHFSWSLFMINTFCKLYLLSYWCTTLSWKCQVHILSTLTVVANQSSKIWPKFVCRYALFLQARSYFQDEIFMDSLATLCSCTYMLLVVNSHVLIINFHGCMLLWNTWQFYCLHLLVSMV